MGKTAIQMLKAHNQRQAGNALGVPTPKINGEYSPASMEPYIALVSDESLQNFLRASFGVAPSYFWTIPASSSGKYHPQWASGNGGNVRHTMFGMYMASQLAGTYALTPLETDIAISAMGVHDLFKYGVKEYDVTLFDMHPFLPRSILGSGRGGHGFNKLVDEAVFDAMMCAVERHMGNMVTGAWTSVRRIRPETPIEIVVHLSDYIASRKHVWFEEFIPIKQEGGGSQ